MNSSFPGGSPARSTNETGDSFVCFYHDVDGGNDVLDEGKSLWSRSRRSIHLNTAAHL